jgi:hypothetical protein
MESVSREEILAKWLEMQFSLRRANQESREARKLFRLLELYHPWLVEFPQQLVDGASFETLQRWMEAGTNVYRVNQELQVAKEQLRVFEEKHPWLLTVKGILSR